MAAVRDPIVSETFQFRASVAFAVLDPYTAAGAIGTLRRRDCVIPDGCIVTLDVEAANQISKATVSPRATRYTVPWRRVGRANARNNTETNLKRG